MNVGVSIKKIESESSILCFKYSLECNLFCVSFFVDVRHYHQDATFDSPEENDLRFDWENIEFADNHDIEEDELKSFESWMSKNRDELESCLGKDFTEIETE